jgi:O-antigen/teichoic acid export membrane protein
MKRLQRKTTILNITANLILQLVNILTWFIIPKLILIYFGSEVNGLVSSITQFLSYIGLIEAGITGVVTASLYKPLVDHDEEKISSILKTSNSFYKKIGLIFTIYAILLALIYPVFLKGFNYIYVFTLTIILSISLLIQYMYSLSLRNLLYADKKGYIVSTTQTIILILTIILSYISVKIYPNIHLLKLISGLLFVLQPIVFGRIIKKNYSINKNAKEDKKLLKERWNGFAINIAAFIHNCTDITLLTIFTNFKTVSIYSVYAIVTTGLRAIVNAIASAIAPTIGHTYAMGNKKDVNKNMDIYEYILFIVIFFFFTIAGILITPFVLLYTKGITDANYNRVTFGILIVIAEAIYLIKTPHLNLAYSANKFKELTKPAYIEATINIIISLLLVNKYGLIGVVIGTITAMTYRLIMQVAFSKKLIDRNTLIFYKKVIIFMIPTIIGITICTMMIPIKELTIINWIIHAIGYSIIMGILYLITSILFFKKELSFIKNYHK